MKRGCGILLGLLVLLGGCVAPPISITQETTTGDGSTEPTVAPYVERWSVVTYERHSPDGAIRQTSTISDDDVQTTKRPERLSRPTQKPTGCPRFELPRIDAPPSVPELDESRRDDYEYIADVLLGHVEQLIRYNADVQSRYADAYKRYVDRCDQSE